MKVHPDLYPVAIIQDRYGGTYSGGAPRLMPQAICVSISSLISAEEDEMAQLRDIEAELVRRTDYWMKEIARLKWHAHGHELSRQ